MFSAKKKHHSPCKVIDRIVVKVCRNVLLKYLLKVFMLIIIIVVIMTKS